MSAHGFRGATYEKVVLLVAVCLDIRAETNINIREYILVVFV